jgi:hypothetical protein
MGEQNRLPSLSGGQQKRDFKRPVEDAHVCCIVLTLMPTHICLGRDNFKSDEFNKLGWVWNNGPWDEMKDLLRTAQVLSRFVALVEDDGATLGYGLEMYMDVRVELDLLKGNLQPRQRKELEDATALRDPFFFR